jgi:hypothetical protein
LVKGLKRLIAFCPHFGDAPLGLLQRILKISDAIRLWFLLWHVIGFLPGEASGPPIRGLFASSIRGGSIWRSPPEVEHGPALGEIDREPDSFPCNPILATFLTLTIHLRRGLRLWGKDAPAAFLVSGPASSGRGG